MYDFKKRLCTKLTGPDVGVNFTKQRQNQNEMVSQLTPGSWVIFKGSGETDQPIWLGRAISKPEWDNSCVWKNNSRCTKMIEGVEIGRHEYAINVQWYTQKVVGVLEYVLDTTKPVVQSNCGLVLAGFDDHMHQVYGSSIRVPRYVERLGQIVWVSMVCYRQQLTCKPLKGTGIEKSLEMSGE